MFDLRARTYSYLKENNDKNKKAKGTNIRRKLEFQDYKNYLKAAQINGKINYLKSKKFNVVSLREFAKNKLILKTKQRFKSERHNLFTEVINKITLNSNDDKRIESVNICIWREQRYNTCERKN